MVRACSSILSILSREIFGQIVAKRQHRQRRAPATATMSFAAARADQSSIEHDHQSHQRAPSLSQAPQPADEEPSLHPGYATTLAAVDVQATAVAAAAAAAAAHHGLQALQAAVQGPGPATVSGPMTPQYAVPGEVSSYLGSSATPIGPSPTNTKQTRLRRACDLCSQRKVKVRLSPLRVLSRCSFWASKLTMPPL